MHPDEFLKQLDEEKIVAAIVAAERGTSGEIRVYVSRRARGDALALAVRRFRKLGMHRTKQRNAVLIYFVPHTRSFAVIGDAAADEKLGAGFWKLTTDHLGANLKQMRPTPAINHAIKSIGEALAAHFPPSDDTREELPDSIGHD